MLRRADRDKMIGYSVFAGVFVVVVALTLIFKKSAGWQIIVEGLYTGCLYALVAMGLSVIYSSTRVINFAQGEFVVLGAMLYYTFTVSAGIPAFLGFVLAVLAVAGVGAGFESIAIRRLSGRSIITMIVATIGLSILLRGIMKWIWGAKEYATPYLSPGPPVHMLGAGVSRQSLWAFGFVALVVVLMYLFYSRTLLGKGMRAAAENSSAASLVGVNPAQSALMAWIIAAALGAAAGIFTPKPYIRYDMGVGIGIEGFSAAVIGGLGSVTGGLIGGLTLGILEPLILLYLPESFSNFQYIIALVILILMMMIRPQGLVGTRETVKV